MKYSGSSKLVKGVISFFPLSIDLLGMATYLMPALGETVDLVFAPISAILLFIMYGKNFFSFAAGVVDFFEEISPGLDFIPTATLMWTFTYVIRKENTIEKIFREKQKEYELLNRLDEKS